MHLNWSNFICISFSNELFAQLDLYIWQFFVTVHLQLHMYLYNIPYGIVKKKRGGWIPHKHLITNALGFFSLLISDCYVFNMNKVFNVFSLPTFEVHFICTWQHAHTISILLDYVTVTLNFELWTLVDINYLFTVEIIHTQMQYSNGS